MRFLRQIPAKNLYRAALCCWLGVGAMADEVRLSADEQVLFFPTIGYQTKRGWEFEVHGWVYEPETRPVLQAALRRSLGLDSDELSADELAIFNERARFFLVDNERGKRFSIDLGGVTHLLARSGANGHFTDRLRLKHEASFASNHSDRLLRLHVNADADRGPATVEVHLLAEHGVSVISDIDDTIKISQVRDRQALVRNTFIRPFEPVPGMASLYQLWATNRNAQFHYVSASPWQLYVPLSQFVRGNGFPAGTFHLKQFRVKDESFLALFASPERYKPGVVGLLFERFPKRRVILVGDSGEKDPEIYGATARRYPEQVSAILIRDVTNEGRNSTRYREAFRRVPERLWIIFKDPRDLSDWALPP